MALDITDLESRTIRRVTTRLVPFLVVCYFVAYLEHVLIDVNHPGLPDACDL